MKSNTAYRTILLLGIALGNFSFISFKTNKILLTEIFTNRLIEEVENPELQEVLRAVRKGEVHVNDPVCEDGRTIAQEAVARNEVCVLEALMRAGANPKIKDKK